MNVFSRSSARNDARASSVYISVRPAICRSPRDGNKVLSRPFAPAMSQPGAGGPGRRRYPASHKLGEEITRHVGGADRAELGVARVRVQPGLELVQGCVQAAAGDFVQQAEKRGLAFLKDGRLVASNEALLPTHPRKSSGSDGRLPCGEKAIVR